MQALCWSLPGESPLEKECLKTCWQRIMREVERQVSHSCSSTQVNQHAFSETFKLMRTLLSADLQLQLSKSLTSELHVHLLHMQQPACIGQDCCMPCHCSKQCVALHCCVGNFVQENTQSLSCRHSMQPAETFGKSNTKDDIYKLPYSSSTLGHQLAVERLRDPQCHQG